MENKFIRADDVAQELSLTRSKRSEKSAGIITATQTIMKSSHG